MKETGVPAGTRRSIRLQTHDYSAGSLYFFTACSHGKRPLFAVFKGGRVGLNTFGMIVLEVWGMLPNRFQQASFGSFVVMPNHVHGIISVRLREIRPEEREGMLLPKIIGFLKMNSSKRINMLRTTPGQLVWQRGYYEHIIRDEKERKAVEQYIRSNPSRWVEDEEYTVDQDL
jgi:REP element-mobilizing transposase RayT